VTPNFEPVIASAKTFALDVYAAALLDGLLRVEGSGGGKLAEQDFDPAPFLGGTFSTRF
jgi:hypothetical protein